MTTGNMPYLSVVLVVAMLMAGCGGATAGSPAQAPQPSQAQSGPVLMSYKAVRLTKDKKVQTSFEEGGTLVSGDYLAFFLCVDRPAYVYLVQFYTNGRRELLFPEGESKPLQAGRWVRTPSDPGVWLKSDEHPGDEKIYIIVSARKLEETDRELAAAVAEIQRSPDAETSSPPPPPPAPGSSPPLAPAPPPLVTREPNNAPPQAVLTPPPRLNSAEGIREGHRRRAMHPVRVESRGATSYEGQTGADEIAIMLFSFHHQ